MKYKFGEKIRFIREKKQITLKEIADGIGMSESLISQIERNKVSPAIDTLLSIAEYLKIDLEYLFSDFKKNEKVNLVKHDKRNKVVLNDVVYQQLSKTIEADEQHGIEAYYLEVNPDGEKGSYEYGHKGKELGIIISGKGELRIGTEVYALEEGDSISFSSEIPHVFKNTGKKLLKAYWITTPPKMLLK